MGGKNHHQCSGCIRHTTLLSKTYSLAEAEMLLANAVLEDTMLAELYGSFDHAKHFAPQINRHLENSVVYLDETKAMAQEILRLNLPYLNGDALNSLDFDAFRRALEKKGIEVGHDRAWNEVAKTFRTGGVRASFSMFIQHLDRLKEITKDVIAAIKEAEEIASKGRKMVDTFEENMGDFKGRFARLITTYSTTSLMFSYSALVTTEAHLLMNSFRSLQAA